MLTWRRKLVWLCLLTLIGAGVAVPDTAWADAPPVNTWKKLDPSPASVELWRVEWLNGKFFAVGQNGTILTSDDGEAWLKEEGLIGGRLNGIAWGSAGYAVVGSAGEFLISANGEAGTWNTRHTFAGRSLFGIAYGDGLYVAVGNGTIQSSSDGGHNWQEGTGLSSGYNYYDILFDDHKFYAVGGRGTLDIDEILVSDDGHNWSRIHGGNANGYLRGIVRGDHGFVAVGQNGRIYQSADGADWTYHYSGQNIDLWDVTWGNHQYVAVGSSNMILTSLDGETWTNATPIGGDSLYGITGVDGHYVAVGGGGAIYHGSYTVNDFHADLTEDGITSRTVSFTWSEAFDATSVAIQQSPAGAEDWTDSAAVIAPDDTGATVTGLTPDTEYDFRLHIVGPWFDDYSNAVTVKTLNEYTVTFDVYGGAPAIAPVQVSYNDQANAPDPAPVKTGYTFAGWYTDTSYLLPAFNFATPIQSDVDLYAKWDINYYTVTFDVYGGTPVPDQSIPYLGQISEPMPPPIKPGFTFGGWYKAADLREAWAFDQDTVTRDLTLYAKWIRNSTDDDAEGSDSDPGHDAAADNSARERGFEIIVNGSKEEQWAHAVTTEVGGKQAIRVLFDEEPFYARLQRERDSFTVIVPVKSDAAAVVGELNGEMVKLMERKQVVLEIQSGMANYTLPAEHMNIDAISERFGANLQLYDIKVKIEIVEPPADTVRIVESAAAREGLAIVVPPLNFAVTAAYGGRTIEVGRYPAYVQRMIAIPDHADPRRITTAVVVEPDGAIRHVPTQVVIVDGLYYARINSLTDSVYATVWHPMAFDDVASHWAKDAVNDVGSRLIVSGIGDNLFDPDRDITRAEFTEIVVRGLGLKPEDGPTPFSDMEEEAWYGDAVLAAYRYDLLSGFEDGSFRPTDKMTREQAMTIIARAMAITGLQPQPPLREVEEAFGAFADAAEVAGWAKRSMADVLQAGIVVGRSRADLAPKAYITRAEAAAIVQRLLQKSGLI